MGGHRRGSRTATGTLTSLGYGGLKSGADLYALLGNEIDLIVEVRIKRRSKGL